MKPSAVSTLSMKPFFSVVIPTLNEEHYLPRLISQLSTQTEHDVELIVVDGGSTDDTKQSVRSYIDAGLCRFYATKKAGVSYQKNYGAKRAHGTYLVFIDADCQVPATLLRTLRAELQKTMCRVLIPAMKTDSRNVVYRVGVWLANRYVALSQYFKSATTPQGMCVMKRTLFEEIHGFRGQEYHENGLFFPEDHDIIMRARAVAGRHYYARAVSYTISLRRYESQGVLRTIGFYIYTTFRPLLARNASEEVSYPMGGRAHKPESTS